MKVKELLGKLSFASDIRTVEFLCRGKYNGEISKENISVNGVWDNREVNMFLIKGKKMIVFLEPIEE